MTIPKINLEPDNVYKSKLHRKAMNSYITLMILASIGLGGYAQASDDLANQKLTIANAQTLTSQEYIQTAEIEPLRVVGNTDKPMDRATPTVEQVKAVIGKNKSPISAERWIELSNELDMPLDFLLVSAFQESHFGTKGRAVQTQNIFNVGNTDCGDGKPAVEDECNRFIESWEVGVFEFAKLIKNCYFNENEEIKIKTWIERDFRAVRCNFKGKRYMSDSFSKFKYKASSKTIQEKLFTV